MRQREIGNWFLRFGHPCRFRVRQGETEREIGNWFLRSGHPCRFRVRQGETERDK